MPTRLNPYISFDGTARQAMEFYQQVFGGNLQVSTYGDVGASGEPQADKLMHSMLETDSGFTLMASDVPPAMQHQPGGNISVSVTGDDDAELRGYWTKLSADGTVAVPLEKQMWGDVFGMCTDKFGITWMVNISGQ
ncbi:VOC family protein [Saccharopolyspora sp. NPDC000359]|uniref:VOC family protein n=1 Tax=Saccharopolyspora sp. NPDC000359 TaxID=3154251 RepID=UPI00331ABD6F